MFVGAYERQLDERGRVALPPAFRSSLGDHCYVFFGEDGCVSVSSEVAFEEQALELIAEVKRGEVTRDRQRAFASSAVFAAIDKQGRLTIEQRLREYATIEPQAGVVVLGSLDRIEIWEPQAYRNIATAGQREIAGGER